MAVIAGTVQTVALNKMADAVAGQTTLYLVANDLSEQEAYSGVVTFGTAVDGVADITSNVSITIPAGGNIDSVELNTSATGSGTGDAIVITDIAFVNGGDLIIESFKITVTAV